MAICAVELGSTVFHTLSNAESLLLFQVVSRCGWQFVQSELGSTVFHTLNDAKSLLLLQVVPRCGWRLMPRELCAMLCLCAMYAVQLFEVIVMLSVAAI